MSPRGCDIYCCNCLKNKEKKEFELHKDFCRECIYDYDLLKEDIPKLIEPKIKTKEFVKEQKEKQKRYRQSPKGRMKRYQYRAKKKKIPFKLTLKDFELLENAQCHYCGEFGLMGYDRIDSSKGYIKNNIVICCSVCNYMKLNMTKDAFLIHIYRIYSFTKNYISSARF